MKKIYFTFILISLTLGVVLGQISGSNKACKNETKVYSISTNYTGLISWDVGDGNIIQESNKSTHSASGATTINVKWNNTGTQNIKATTNIDFNGEVYVFGATLSLSPSSSTISSGSSITITASVDLDAYSWSSSPSTSIACTSNSCTFNPTANIVYTLKGKIKNSVNGSEYTCLAESSATSTITVQTTPPISGNEICCDQSVCNSVAPITQKSGVTLSGGDTTNYTYQWESSTNNTNFTAISGATSASYTPTLPTVITYYRRKVTGSGGVNSISTSVSITPLPTNLNISSTTYTSSQSIRARNIVVEGTIGTATNTSVLINAVDGIEITGTSEINTDFVFQTEPCASGARIAYEDAVELESSKIASFGNFSIFPNPNSGSFTISFPDASASYEVKVSDVLGNLVFSDVATELASKEFTLPNVSNGLYIVDVKGGGTSYKQKVQVLK